MQHTNEHALVTQPGLPPEQSPQAGRQHRRGIRTAAIVALIVLLAVVFGTGLFSGWVLGTRSSGNGPPAPTPTATTPAVTTSGQSLDTIREAVVEQVRPTVVQINTTTSSGEGLGSGVILDSRGYIVTNNHVVSGAQRIQVTLYFAIPSNRVKLIAPQLIQSGKMTNTGRAAMGVQITSVDAAQASERSLAVSGGALIVGTASGGPAAAAGLKPGDVIAQIGTHPVLAVADVADALLTLRPGEVVSVTLYRGSERLTLKVTLGEARAS